MARDPSPSLTPTDQGVPEKDAGRLTGGFSGFLPLASNTTYTPNQFFDVCLPHCSRSAIRLVGYFIRRTLGWCDQYGQPQEEQVEISFRELAAKAGVSRDRLRAALDEAIAGHFIDCVREGRPSTARDAGQSAIYRLRWHDTPDYHKSPGSFHGFFEREGNRTDIPVTGHRRFRAARAAGLGEVEVLIREPEAEFQRRLKSLISNVQRENLSAIEMAEALQSILTEDLTIRTQQELGRRIGKSKQWVSEMLQVLTLPPALQLKVRSSELPLAYDAVMKISHVDIPEEQAALIDAALRGESAASIREKVRTSRRQTGTETPRNRRTERVQESLNGYTAIVSGPVSLEADRHMRAVVEALLERLQKGLN